MKSIIQKVLLAAALVSALPLAAKRHGDDGAEERGQRERQQRIREQIENKREAKEREERQQAINKYVGAVEANGGQAPKWAQKSEGARLYNDVNQKFQTSINVAQQNAVTQGAAAGLSPAQIAQMQAQLKADIRAGGTIAPATMNANANIQNIAVQNKQAAERQLAREQHAAGERSYSPSQTAAQIHNAGETGAPTPSTKADPLAGMTLQEIEKWAKERKLSVQETRDLLSDYRNKNTTLVFGTVGLTDNNGKAYLDMVCPQGSTTCKQAGSLNVYGDPTTGSARKDLKTDFFMDMNAMMTYQLFLDKGTFNPKTGKVEIPDKVCLRPGSGPGGCADWQYRNEAVTSLGLNPFSKTDDQVYMSIDQMMAAAVNQACGGKKCNGLGQDVVMAGHSAGGVSGTIAAIALNNAGFDVEKMSGYEMVMNTDQYKLLTAMGTQVTNYTAKDSNTPASLAGMGIGVSQGSVIAPLVRGGNTYYTGYVNTPISGLTDGHEYENAGVVPTIQTALFTDQTPKGNIPGSTHAPSGVNNPYLPTTTALSCPTGTRRIGGSHGSCVADQTLPLGTVPLNVPQVQVITSSQLPVGGQDYVPPMTPAP